MIWTQKTVLYTLVTKESEGYLIHHILYEVTNDEHYRWLGRQEMRTQGEEISHNIKEICNEAGTYGSELEVTNDLLENDKDQAAFIINTLQGHLSNTIYH